MSRLSWLRVLAVCCSAFGCTTSAATSLDSGINAHDAPVDASDSIDSGSHDVRTPNTVDAARPVDGYLPDSVDFREARDVPSGDSELADAGLTCVPACPPASASVLSVCEEGRCLVAHRVAQWNQNEAVFETDGTSAYWASAIVTSGGARTVSYATTRLDGSSASTDLVTGLDFDRLGQPSGIEIDSTGRNLFWNDNGWINRFRIGGTAAEIATSRENDYGPFDLGRDAIVAVRGHDIVTLDPGLTAPPVRLGTVVASRRPRSLRIRGEHAYVHWLSGANNEYGVLRVPLSGGPTEDITSGTVTTLSYGFDVDDSIVAVATYDGIFTAPISGGPPTRVGPDSVASYGVALAGRRVVWTSAFNMGEVDLSTGEKRVLARFHAGQLGSLLIRVVGANAFFTTWQYFSESRIDVNLWRVALP